MKLTRSFLAANLIFTLVFTSFLTLAIPSVSAQDSKVALQRGYRTGYSDGYMSGYRDAIENATKSYARHSEYRNADRAFNKDYGNLSDYKDGYQQGFEKGYDTGFLKQSFDATIPSTLKTRGVIDATKPIETPKTQVKTTTKPKKTERLPVENNVATNSVNTSTSDSQPIKTTTPPENTVAKTTDTTDSTVNNSTDTNSVENTTTDETTEPDSTNTYTPPANVSTNTAPTISNRTEPQRSNASGGDIIIIPSETELIIELLDEIDTKRVREGDQFKARVVSPTEISGAIIEGRIAKNRRPGRLKRRAELLLSFDRIVLSQSRWSNFNAIIVEVLPLKGDNVKRVDQEGLVQGTRPYKKDGITVGGATGTGAVIGAVVGGPVGAAVGAGVGAAFGVGAVVVERGQWIKLQEQQQMRIKTAYETQIR